MRCYAFVLASMYRYSWLITFEIFRNIFFGIEGWVGGVYHIQTFFGFLYFLYLQGPLGRRRKREYSYQVIIRLEMSRQSMSGCTQLLLPIQ